MKSKITISSFEEFIKKLHPRDFEKLVYDILTTLIGSQKIEFNPIIENRQFDIVISEESNLSNSATNNWIVEIKRYQTLIPVSVIEQFYAKTQYSLKGGYRLLFVTISGLTRSAIAFAESSGIEIWTARELFERVDEAILSRYFSTGDEIQLAREEEIGNHKEVSLRASLEKIRPGKEEWSQYQQTVFDILEHLFCPPLEVPHYELIDADARNRRDIIFENGAKEEFWKTIRDVYQGYYIVVDAKNYSKALTKRPIVDIAHYLKPYGCGMFGIIVSRKGSGKSSDHAIKEQWIGNNKMIIVLSDEDVNEMLELKENGGYPESVIRRKLASFRMRL